MNRLLASLIALLTLSLVACGGSATEVADAPLLAPGVRVVAADDAAAIHESRPADLVVLDVRTPEEFQQGHLAGSIMLDFYSPDFQAQIAELDRDVPYLLYCRSGNRSGQTRALMESLGFSDVADLDGGILSWLESGYPIVTE